METVTENKMCSMRLMLSVKEVEWFKTNFPGIKWEAGHTEVRWNANDPDEVELARKAFKAYKEKHPKAMAFKVNPEDKKDAKSLDAFDPNAEYIIMQDFLHKG
jgi:hypothetical protein